MKRLLSIRYSAGAFNFSMLVLRLGAGLLMLTQSGMYKLTHFTELSAKFYNFLHLGDRVSLMLAIFAEVFCSFFVILGLFTRLAVVPLIITMCVAFFGAVGGDLVKGQSALLFLTCYIVLLFLGPGRVSVDGMIKK
jgi:putative oxidoreductase